MNMMCFYKFTNQFPFINFDAFATNLLRWKWHYDAFVKILRDMVSYMLMR